MKEKPRIELFDVRSPNIENFETYSPFALKIHRALKFLKVEYKVTRVGSPRKSPTGKIPVLMFEGNKVTDSTEVLKLLDSYLGNRLTQGSDKDLAWIWEEFGDSCLFPYLLASRFVDENNFQLLKKEFFYGHIWSPLIGKKVRKTVLSRLSAQNIWNPNETEECWSRFKEILDYLNRLAPVDNFWLGENLSVADLSLFSQLHMLRVGLSPLQSSWIKERSALDNYLDRINKITT